MSESENWFMRELETRGVSRRDFMGLYDKAVALHGKYRQLAKAWNFGKPGAMGQFRFIKWALTAYQVEVTPDEERAYTQQWHRKWPEMRRFWDHVRSMECPGGLTTIVQPRSGRVRGGLRFPEVCNTQFQGLAADAALEGVWRLFVASLTPSSALHGSEPLLFVHDENVCQVPAVRAEAAKAEQERIMIQAFRRWCPDVPGSSAIFLEIRRFPPPLHKGFGFIGIASI